MKPASRAPPRKRKESVDDQQPQFLRKAYYMIGSCPPEIGGWSEAGDSFIIKDSNRFAEEIIPTVYKHNKFTSFVRQLNFYGFRKVRSDLNQSALWWEFKHPLFRRGEPHLLVEIKKSVHFEAAATTTLSQESFNELKDEVESMKQQLQYMEKMIRDLALTQRPIIGIPPRHIADSSPSSHQYSSEVLSAAGVMMGIPMDLPPSRSESKKRQRITQNGDSMPAFVPSILDNSQVMPSSVIGAATAEIKKEILDSSKKVLDSSLKVDDLAWDELETFFETEMAADGASLPDLEGVNEPELDEMDEMDDDNESEVFRGPLLRGLSNNGDTLAAGEIQFCEDNFDALTHPDMLVAPASIIVNDSIQQWEWAAVGQVLSAPVGQECQVDQLADALLSSTLDNTSGLLGNQPSSSNEIDALTATQVRPFVPVHSITEIAELVLNLPTHLQERFTDRFSTVLGERLADHLAKQAEDVHLAMVEATYGGVYADVKKDGELMDVSHYAQVVTAVSSPNSEPTPEVCNVQETVSTPVANIPIAPTTAYPSVNATSGTIPAVHALAHIIGATASQVGMSFPILDVTPSCTIGTGAVVNGLDCAGIRETIDASGQSLPNADEGDSCGRPAPDLATSANLNGSSAPNPSACGQCPSCRASALLNLYQPQQPAIAYPLAAAALGALFLRWGDFSSRHQL